MVWIFRSRIWMFETFLEMAGQPADSPPDPGLNSETPAKLGYVIPSLGLSKHRNHSELKSAEMYVKALNKCSSPGVLTSPPRALEFSVCNHYHLKYYLSCLQPGFGLLACGLEIRNIKQNTCTNPLCFLCKIRLCT